MKGIVYMVRSLTDHSSLSKCFKSIRNDISESGLATPMCVFVYVHVLACLCTYGCMCMCVCMCVNI